MILIQGPVYHFAWRSIVALLRPLGSCRPSSPDAVNTLDVDYGRFPVDQSVYAWTAIALVPVG